MKKIKLVLLFLIVGIVSHAQQAESDSSSNSIYKFDAYFLNNYALGYTLFSNYNSEFRLVLGVNSSHGTSNNDEITENISNGVKTTNKFKYDSENGYHQLNFNAQYLYVFYRSNLGESYLGVGPFLGYRLNNYTSSNENNNVINEYSNSENQLLLGITALVGLRSYLTESLSIFAETQLNGFKSWQDNERDGNDGEGYEYKASTEGSGWGYDFYYVRFGLRFSL